jgi:hypothetical protein
MLFYFKNLTDSGQLFYTVNQWPLPGIKTYQLPVVNSLFSLYEAETIFRGLIAGR